MAMTLTRARVPRRTLILAMLAFAGFPSGTAGAQA
jgi:hypothetical protein